MGIKLKNRYLLIAMTLLLFTFGVTSLLTLLGQGDRYVKNYYQTSTFSNRLYQYIQYLSTYKLNPITKAEAAKNIQVSNDEIMNNYRLQFGDGTPTAKEKAKIRDALLSKKRKAIEDNFANKEKARASQSWLASSFHYYLKDIKTGAVYTDIHLKSDETINQFLKKQQMAYVKDYPSAGVGYLSTVGQNRFVSNDSALNQNASAYSGVIMVPASQQKNTVILKEAQEYHTKQMLFFVYCGVGLMSLITSLLLVWRFRVLMLFKKNQWQATYDRLPIDLCIVIFLLIGHHTLSIIEGYLNNFHYYGLFNLIKDYIISSIFIILTLVQIKWLWQRLSRQKDVQSEWKHTLIYRGSSGLSDALQLSSTGMQLLWLLFVVFCTGVGVPIVISNGADLIPFYVILFVIITLPTLLIAAKRIASFNRISRHVDNIAKGQVEASVPIEGWSTLRKLAENINTLKRGVVVARNEMSKSERLKTELITNVSHDLRTPLTSIITYSELLQAEGLSEKERRAYTEIIDRKSKRLKVLIEDLFEASKMATGNIELDKKKVDMGQLLQQALAENDERISASGLQFRVTKPDTPLYAVVDGQKLWRVFDNLIGNILKYSLENTRVFIGLKDNDGQLVITFKNITKYELSEDIDELFERFKRGDESRHTEGSGLGLAIAKSIIDLHDGSLDIEVDGDLFKVIILLEAARQ
ncbi:two-component sensor histidine kinase [Pullulanibacillus camelliae]|uniref:histidine kinase n=1 Tax=Pullulanibacillus camelliae TaxID=1707096 RepID=A0A8J2VIH5_9BACL|nr:HAMP domain-containing sensor histidine kinase [Pullulanibacillus camelliae]GGE30811.1 two-component sensor histidine kinase [Pullulanibacillus camelliae]